MFAIFSFIFTNLCIFGKCASVVSENTVEIKWEDHYLKVERCYYDFITVYEQYKHNNITIKNLKNKTPLEHCDKITILYYDKNIDPKKLSKKL